MTVSDLQRYPCNLYLINDVEDIVVFLDLKVLISDNYNKFSAQITFVEEPQLKTIFLLIVLRQNFPGYCCESRIAIIACWVVLKQYIQ